VKQVAQAVNGGLPRVVEVPGPLLRPGGVLVKTAWSLVSAGTDRLTVELAGKDLLGKARSRPEQVRKVLGKLRTEGFGPTMAAVNARLSGDLPLGYSAAGRIVAVGRGVDDLAVGQAVACAGMGYASHAEEIFVPRNLVAPVPAGLGLREASTATLGAIALQGVRRAEVTLGECVGVVGLGFIGLVTVQLLRAAGCRVLAMDLDAHRADLARTLGAELAVTRADGDLAEKARLFGGGHGLDAVIVTAGTSSSDPTVLAAKMCRLGGKVVVVGAVGMDLPRRVFFEKELDLRLARSYGPGRYDPAYEEKGIDYPYSYVRFTEGRNLSSFLALLGRGEVDVEPLLDREFGIEEGEDAYRLLLSGAGRSVVGLLFSYGEEAPTPMHTLPLHGGRVERQGVGVGLIGAGSFARSVLLPMLRDMPAFRATGVLCATGLNAVNAGKLGGFDYATTRLDEVLEDEGTDAVVIASRHGEHAATAIRALAAGKDVFLEKPLAMTHEELARVTEQVEATGRIVMVGFNRRFAPSYQRLRALFLNRTSPLQMLYRVDGGAIPAGHWTRDIEEGGGRILGEACHFIDLMLHLAGAEPVRVFAEAMPEDAVSATVRFADGSVGTLVYATSGSSGLGKERLEVYGQGTTAVLDDFRSLSAAGAGGSKRIRVGRGKGHREELRAFLDAVRDARPSPVPFGQAAWSTRATLALMDSLALSRPVTLRRS
jgi:predicted dehydrogenase/threonine dehydrogenase-like Zn-dependent dehydrogenase